MTDPKGHHSVLSLTAINVEDLDRAADFYIEGCGFVHDKDLETPTFRARIVRAGDAGIELIAPLDRSDDVLDHGNMMVKLVVTVADTADRVARACAHGGIEVLPVTLLADHGMVIATVRDPDGYLVEFVQRLESM
jgi:lactoylglutathione lyase